MPRQIKTANTGPFTFPVDESLSPGQRFIINTSEERGEARGKKGYYRKYYGQRGGFDQVQVQNGSGLLIEYRTGSGESGSIPPATSETIQGQSPEGQSEPEAKSYRVVTIINPQFNSSDVDGNEVFVSFMNGPRPEESPRGLRFGGPQKVVEDIIPGF